MRKLRPQPRSRGPHSPCQGIELGGKHKESVAPARLERGANDYLLKLVDPNWIRPIKNETTFFTRVTLIEMLAEMTKDSGTLERVNTVDLLV